MPKLIVDAWTLEMLQSKMSGRQSIYAGANGRLLEPGVINVVDENSRQGCWQPVDHRTKLIVLGAEACRAVVLCAERLDEHGSRARVMKNLTVPVCNLMKIATTLKTSLDHKEWSDARLSWPSSDQANFRATAKRINKTHLNGPVKAVRNRLTAHLDPAAFSDVPHLRWKDVLEALGDALVLFVLGLNHPSHAFSWIRDMGTSDDGSRIFIETMFEYPASVRWTTDHDGKVTDFGAVVLAADPRLEIKAAFLAALAVHSELIRATGTHLPSISESSERLYVDPTADTRPWTKRVRLLRTQGAAD